MADKSGPVPVTPNLLGSFAPNAKNAMHSEDIKIGDGRGGPSTKTNEIEQSALGLY
jgi:hypothetical protein